jgi:hypothetical protein
VFECDPGRLGYIDKTHRLIVRKGVARIREGMQGGGKKGKKDKKNF